MNTVAHFLLRLRCSCHFFTGADRCKSSWHRPTQPERRTKGKLHEPAAFANAESETTSIGSGLLAAAPLNDNICDATEVFLNTTVPWDNFDATEEMGEPNPGPGTDGDGCNSQNGWCNITDSNEPGVQSSIWYKFTATSNCVTISINDNIDMQLALWGVTTGGSVCPGPLFSNLTEIAANDDSGPGGGFSPIIQSARVTKDQVYYTQLDGFNETFGNGTISFSDCLVRTGEHHYCP
jgi:hypothetical protein